MARRAKLTAEAVLEELELELEHDLDVDEPMMPGSDDEFSDLDDIEDDDDNDDDHCSLPHSPASGSSSDIGHSPSHPPPSDTPGLNSDSVRHSPSHSSPSDTPDTLPCWTSTLTPVTITPFTSPVCPKVAIPESPSDIFQLMFTPALLDSIVEQSNLYAKEVMGEEKYSSWVKITSEELKAYLGFCILMGINHLPALDYWSTDPALHYSPVANRITRDCFGRYHVFSTL